MHLEPVSSSSLFREINTLRYKVHDLGLILPSIAIHGDHAAMKAMRTSSYKASPQRKQKGKKMSPEVFRLILSSVGRHEDHETIWSTKVVLLKTEFDDNEGP